MNTKLLIADSGATKTDWLYAAGDMAITIQTQGLHPATLEERSDLADLRAHIGKLEPDRLLFFGTGCGNPASDEVMRRFLQSIFPQIQLEINSDLDGSGRAFFGDGDGVVAVLGTGAICAKIEDGRVVKKSAALGYAIGDEGSAADLGRRILRIYFRRPASDPTVQFIGDQLDGAGYPEMMNRIYTSSKPNRELASVAGRVLSSKFPVELEELIRSAFRDFINHQLSTLELSDEEEIIFTGKVADTHRELLLPLMQENGYRNVAVRYPVIAAWKERLQSAL